MRRSEKLDTETCSERPLRTERERTNESIRAVAGDRGGHAYGRSRLPYMHVVFEDLVVGPRQARPRIAEPFEDRVDTDEDELFGLPVLGEHNDGRVSCPLDEPTDVAVELAIELDECV